jgi:hypothetical protein
MDKITDLSQTVELMSSEDYKDRFIAEYAQVKIRYLRLTRVLKRIEDKSAPDCFEPTCDIELLKMQHNFMIGYLFALIERAIIEGIELPEVEI